MICAIHIGSSNACFARCYFRFLRFGVGSESRQILTQMLLLTSARLLQLAVTLLFTSWFASACQTRITTPHDIPVVDVLACSSSSSSYSLGRAVGQITKTLIQDRCKGAVLFQCLIFRP
jgi:hypothetical protein